MSDYKECDGCGGLLDTKRKHLADGDKEVCPFCYATALGWFLIRPSTRSGYSSDTMAIVQHINQVANILLGELTGGGDADS